MLLVLDQDYISWLFFFSTIICGFYKAGKFRLPHQTLERELVVLIVFQVLNQIRLYIAIKGNKTEKGSPPIIGSFMLLSVLSLFGFVYFLRLQTFALLIEYVVVGIALIFGFIETLMMLAQFIDYRSLEKAE